MIKRTIDYCFISPNTLDVVGALDIPRDKDILHDVGNPCYNHPSDHYALAFKFAFKAGDQVMKGNMAAAFQKKLN